MHGKTFVGNNEDYWNGNTRIWFEKGSKGQYGCMFIGYDDMYPQGAINEKGLAYDGFYIDEYVPRTKPKKPVFTADQMAVLMKTCQNVDEAYVFLSNFSLVSFRRGMVAFIDRSGRYLTVEADTMLKGNDEKYIWSNFCPSRTPDLNTVNIPHFQRGRKMLQAKVDTSLNYLKSLSDTLHQEWPLNGAGTLYTTIYDLNEGIIHLFFYNDYTRSIKYSLKEQLKENDTIFVIPSLFPGNVKGQDQFSRYNRTKDMILLIRKSALAKDSVKLKDYIKSNDLKAVPGFFETEIDEIGNKYLKEGKIETAINVLRLNVRYSPHSWRSHFSLAEAYKKHKDYEMAIIYYERSLEKNPNNEVAQKAVKKINKRLNR